MKLTIERIAFKDTYTIGKLYLNNSLFCDTLEDKVRADGVKVYGETAIPAGLYKVILTYSNRFKRILPLVCDVPKFSGIRIHPGNTSEDTKGCILVGINDVKGRISNSKATFEALMPLMQNIEHEEAITLEIINKR